jgi:hypothetical protein
MIGLEANVTIHSQAGKLASSSRSADRKPRTVIDYHRDNICCKYALYSQLEREASDGNIFISIN